MKTHATETNDSHNFTHLMFLATFVLFLAFITLISNYGMKSLKTKTSHSYLRNDANLPLNSVDLHSNSIMEAVHTENLKTNLLPRIDNLHFMKTESMILETEKLMALNMDRISMLSENRIETTENLGITKTAAEANFAMVQLNEYLIPAVEEELEVVIIATDNIPEAKTKYHKNEYLENLMNVKVFELENFYATQQILKEYLVVEKELPLQIEEWMIGEKCWCLDGQSKLASNENTEK